MAKIGIVTFWWSQDNYGQLLQCFASQKYLQNLGHDAFLIKVCDFGEEPQCHETSIARWHKVFSLSHWKFFLRTQWGRVYSIIVNRLIQNHEVDRHFDAFREQYIRSTDKIYSHQDLFEDPPQVDVLVTGSDMVWGAGLFRTEYFLDFASKGVKRFSISASFGRNYESLTDSEKQTIVDNLSKFQGITVREYEGLNICQSLGFRNATVVCDPTMMIDIDIYKSIMDESVRKKSERSAFIYFLGSDASYIDDHGIVTVLRQRRMPFNLCASECIDTIPKIFPSIEEWLSYIYYSDFVITNSFHGTIFCMLFGKQFAVIPLRDSQRNTRIESLLGEVGILDRICYTKSDMLLKMDVKIDYNTLAPKIKKMIDNSKRIVHKMFIS